MIRQYAMSVSRWVQCEEAVSNYGFLAKHPTTGQAIASPYVAMGQNFIKQAYQQWNAIYQIVREHCTVDYDDVQDDPMERLLRERMGRR